MGLQLIMLRFVGFCSFLDFTFLSDLSNLVFSTKSTFELFPDHFFDLPAVFDDLGVGDAPDPGKLCIGGSSGSAASKLQHSLVNSLQSGG